MASQVFKGELTIEDVLELPSDELRDELSGREIDPKGKRKVDMQKALMKSLSPVVPVAPVVTQPVSPRNALPPQQQMEFEVMRLEMESEQREKRLRLEAEALERKEKSEAEALEWKERIEREREALDKKESQEAEALEKREKKRRTGSPSFREEGSY